MRVHLDPLEFLNAASVVLRLRLLQIQLNRHETAGWRLTLPRPIAAIMQLRPSKSSLIGLIVQDHFELWTNSCEVTARSDILFAMLKLLVRFLFGTLVLLAIFTSAPAIAGAKHKDSPCDKPREIASRPQLSKEDQAKARKIRAQGYVNISISEEGDVIDAKVVQASSPEAVDLLLTFAKTAKFKPRPGCGITHGAINYTLANH